MRPHLSVKREWTDMEELRGSGNREYAIQVDIKVIPRRATLRMETRQSWKPKSSTNKLGSDGGRQHTVVSSWESGSPANGIF